MKKMKFYCLVVLASFILASQSFGQKSQIDSLKTDLNLSSEVVKKLDNKELVEIIKYREKLNQQKVVHSELNYTPNEWKLTYYQDFETAFYTFFAFIFVLLLITIPFYFNLKKAKGRQQIINNLIERGQEIPKELISSPIKTGRPDVSVRRSDFHKGVILICLGLSLCIVLMVLKIANNYWTIGLIPMFIGIGYVISFKFDGPSKRKSEIE